tara:strand:- start:140 stop:391 length:252 start_codon:yes stop_codon:yes gene_type:complete
MNKTYFYLQTFLLATILTLASSCNGQGKLPKEGKSEPIKYGAGDIVTNGLLDKDGNIWFGGRYGILWRYDGEVLTDFTQQKRL